MQRLPLALAFSLFAAPAFADCDHFKWSVAKEREWFAAPAALPAVNGSAETGKAYTVTLSKDVKLPTASEKETRPGTFGAVVQVPKVAAGLYQITLSAEAWLDVVQNNALVHSSGFSGQRDCPGVRKSVRFGLAEGPTTIEISNAATDQIVMAIAPAN